MSSNQAASSSLPSDPATSEVLSAMKTAGNCLQEFVDKKKGKSEFGYPRDVEGFLMTVGADLCEIKNVATRRALMIDIQSLILKRAMETVNVPSTTATDSSWENIGAYSSVASSNVSFPQGFMYSSYTNLD